MMGILFVNACILITFTSIFYHIIKNNGLTYFVSFKLKIFKGIFYGLVGIILMFYSFHVNSTVIMDFRYISIIIASIYGGVTSAIISAIIIGVFRVAYFGVNNCSIIAFIMLIFVGGGCGVLSHIKLSRLKKWIYSNLYSVLVFAIGFIFLVEELNIFLQVVVTYIIGTILVSAIIYPYIEHLDASNILFRRLRDESSKDFLTGLNNRRSFYYIFNTIVNEIKDKEEKLSLLFIDIDFFKEINDTYGHHNGDVVLKEIASLLIESCRDFEIISRHGGEEFSILLRDCSVKYSLDLAERIRKKVESNKFNLFNEIEINITVSIGVAIYPDSTTVPEELIILADSALYEAKRTGRNKVVLFNEQIKNFPL